MKKSNSNIQFHDDIAIADTAFTVKGKDENELFENAGTALFSAMADTSKIEPKITRTFFLTGNELDVLLFDFLNELLFYKDSEHLLFSSFTVSIKTDNSKLRLESSVSGEEAQPDKHTITTDIKAVTMHLFEVTKSTQGYTARVVVDI